MLIFLRLFFIPGDSIMKACNKSISSGMIFNSWKNQEINTNIPLLEGV